MVHKYINTSIDIYDSIQEAAGRQACGSTHQRTRVTWRCGRAAAPASRQSVGRAAYRRGAHRWRTVRTAGDRCGTLQY